MIKKYSAVLAALVAVLVLDGCGAGVEDGSGVTEESSTSNNSPSDIRERTLILNNGDTVTCLVINGSREAAMSCDWGSSGGFE